MDNNLIAPRRIGHTIINEEEYLSARASQETGVLRMIVGFDEPANQSYEVVGFGLEPEFDEVVEWEATIE